MINEIIAEKLAMLPNSPGVYIMKDAEGTIRQGSGAEKPCQPVFSEQQEPFCQGKGNGGADCGF